MKVLKEVTLFKNHGGKTGDWKIQAVVAETRELNPPAHLVISHTKVVGGAAVTKEVPVEAKNIGRANQTSASIRLCGSGCLRKYIEWIRSCSSSWVSEAKKALSSRQAHQAR